MDSENDPLELAALWVGSMLFAADILVRLETMESKLRLENPGGSASERLERIEAAIADLERQLEIGLQ